MVIIEEAFQQQQEVKVARKKDSCDKRRCYAVKVCIEKSPSPSTPNKKCAQTRIQVDPTCRVVKKHVDPCCPCPQFNCAVEPEIVLPPLKKRTKKCGPVRKEQDCQTCAEAPCRKNEKDVQCSLWQSKCVQDSPCQTTCREVKHSGHQTCAISDTPCNTKHCQTDLETACGAVGVSHDRSKCCKACCKNKKKAREKRDQACGNDNNNTPCFGKKKRDNCRPTGNQRKCGKPVCEQQYEFPFVGRTSSGNLKVCPEMISYENKEFGVLVANPSCIRTSVRRISSCDMIYHRHAETCSPPPCCPPSPPSPPCFPRQALACSCSSKESCKTAQPWLPPPIPRHHKSRVGSPPHQHPHTPCNHPYFTSGDDQLECDDDLELIKPQYFPPERGCNNEKMCYKVEACTARTHVSHNGKGHADGWNYVNPEYQSQHKGSPPQRSQAAQQNPSSKRSRGVGVSESVKVKSTQQLPYASTIMPLQHSEGYLDLDAREPESYNENLYKHNYSSYLMDTMNAREGSYISGLGPGANYDGRAVPYVPSFPQEQLRQQPPLSEQMSDRDDPDGKAISIPTSYLSRSASTRQASSHPSSDPNPTLHQSRMEGRLHYVVKGTVDPDATVKVGDAVFPVHSVVLEIRSKLPASNTSKVGDEYDDQQIRSGYVRLPDFNSSVPITFPHKAGIEKAKSAHHFPYDNSQDQVVSDGHQRLPDFNSSVPIAVQGSSVHGTSHRFPDGGSAMVGEDQSVAPRHGMLPDLNSSVPITVNSGSGRHFPDDRSAVILEEDQMGMPSQRESRRHMTPSERQSASYDKVMAWDHRDQELPAPPTRHPSARSGKPPLTRQGAQYPIELDSGIPVEGHQSTQLNRSMSGHPPGFQPSDSQEPNHIYSSQAEFPAPTPSCQSCRSNNPKFHKVDPAPSGQDFPEEDKLHDGLTADDIAAHNLVPIHTQDTILGIAEPDSSIMLREQEARRAEKMDDDEESIVGIANDDFDEEPYAKTAEELRKEEEKISASDGVLPNLDVIQNAVLVFGGVNPKLPITPGNSGKDVFMYTRETNEWSVVGVLPHPRTHFGLARVNNTIYIIGGTDPEHKDCHGKNIAVHSNLRLNLRSGKWSVDTGLDHARSHFGCVALGKQIFVIGGNVESRATSSCLVFDTESHAWNTIAPLDTTRANMGIAVYNNGILVAGGTSKTIKKPVLETVRYYEPTLDSWTVWKSLPSPRAFCSLAVASSKRIYLIAGAGLRDISKRKNSSLPDILNFDHVKNDWVEVGVLRHSRHGHATAILDDDNVLIIAGISSHTAGAINRVEVWTPSTGKTVNVANMPQAHSGMVALEL